MKVEVSELRDIIGMLLPVISKKPSIPVLGYILLGDGKAIAGDGTNYVIIDFPAADEEILLTHDIIEYLKHTPGNEIADITVSVPEGESSLMGIINCGGSKRSFPYMEYMKPGSYPPLPEIPETIFDLDGDELLDAMVAVADYASTDETRIVLTGVNIVVGPEDAFVAAGDGYRMAMQHIRGRYSEQTLLNVPWPSIPIIRDLWKKSARSLSLGFSASVAEIALAKRCMSIGQTYHTTGEDQNDTPDFMTCRFGNVTVITRLIKGTPPQWLSVIPDNRKSVLHVFCPELYRAVMQVKDVASKCSYVIRLAWQDGKLNVSARGEGEIAETEIAVTITGKDDYIGLNAKYLLGYLKGRQGMVRISIESCSASVVFNNGRDTVVIMPVHLAKPKADDTPGDTAPDTADDKQPVTAGESPAKPKRTRKAKAKATK